MLLNRSQAPFSFSTNDLFDGSDPQNIKFNFRVFIEVQDGFDFQLEEGTVACIRLSTSIDAPIVIGGENTVVSSPTNIMSAKNQFCVGSLISPTNSLLLNEDPE